MTTFYLDPVGGNDSNDGTTFANRWRTITSGATAARIAPGDQIRVIAGPDVTDMGQNATWTEGTRAVELTSAVTQEISAANTAWTPSTNASSTTNTLRKLGSASSQIAVTATFTTGKAAYLTLPAALDLSSYQQVSFWIRMSAGSMLSDGDVSLRLCSDTTGDVTVNTIPVTRIRLSNKWQAFTVNLGTALGSSIQSIALFIEADRAAQTFIINNIIACKASSSADSLTLNSLISKNTDNDPWYCIESISGTSIKIQNSPEHSLSSFDIGFYGGATATATLFKREPIILPSAFVANSNLTTNALSYQFGFVNDSGVQGNPIVFSGGWNNTDMSTQTGDTFISGVNNTGFGIFIRFKNYITFDKINPCNFSVNLYTYYDTLSSDNMVGINFTAHTLASGTTGVIFGGTNGNACGINDSTLTVGNIVSCATYGLDLVENIRRRTATNTITVGNINTNYNIAVKIDSSGLLADNISLGKIHYNNTGLNLAGLIRCNLSIGSVKNNSGGGISFSGTMYDNKIIVTEQIVNNSNGIVVQASGTIDIDLNSAVISGNTNSDITNSVIGRSLISNGIWDSSAKFMLNGPGYVVINNPSSLVTPNITDSSFNNSGLFTFSNLNNNTQKQQTTYRNWVGNIVTDDAIRHTASGVSWKMTLGSVGEYRSPDAVVPLSLPIAQVAVASSSLVTARVWVYRTNSSLTSKLICRGGQISGVVSDVTAIAAGDINTWEQLTITFTPTQAGVVELAVQAYGAVASVYVDDLTVSQA